MAAYTTINKPSLHFNTKLYTGTGSQQTISGVGFQPDWTWIKLRNDNTANHELFDIVRGATKYLGSNTTAAEQTDAQKLQSWNTDGFVIGTNGNVNQNSSAFASWNWKANGQGSSNTDGSINTTYTSVNTTAGFSISKYTGTGSAATVGHGLGVAPKMVIVKRLNNADGWQVYVDGLSSVNHYLRLDTNAAEASDSSRFGAAPTASVFSVGTANGTNASGNTYIAYCFAEKRGYSKIGSYTGNGNANGSFIYTGFSPAWFLVKRTNGANGWYLYDNKRPGYNLIANTLSPNTSAVEDAGTGYNAVDFVSNGVKIRQSNPDLNTSGSTYIYIAFAENPIVDSTGKIPATAR